MASGDLAKAESFAVRALNVAAEPGQYELLIELYAQAGQESKLADATRALAKLHRDRGDEEKARELMQRLPVEEIGSSSRLAVDVSEIAEPDLGDEELLDEEPFLSLSDDVEDQADLGGDEIDLDLHVEDSQPGDDVEPIAIPEGDPDQLLAEANVYLRYGKRDQAIASLCGVIAQDPNHRAALEKLGEAYADDDQAEKAVDTWKRAAVQVREAGDAEALAVLRDRIAALDPAAAEQIGAVEAGDPSTPEIALDLDVEVDLDLDHAIDEVASSETQSGLDFDTAGDDFEIELDDEPLEGESETEPAVPEEPAQTVETAAPEVEVEVQVDVQAEVEVEIPDEDEGDFEFEMDDVENPPDASATGSTTRSSTTTTGAKITEELEEAEFYIAQEMFDEAEEILSRILEAVPDHPSAMLRMGEIAAARGPATDSASTERVADVTIEAPVESTEDGISNDFDVTARIDEDEGQADLDDEFEIELDDDDDDDDESAEEEHPLAASASEVSIEPEPEPEPEVEVAPVVEPSADEGETIPAGIAASAEDEAGDSFDLREALADVLGDDEELPSDDETSGVLSTVEDGFGSIFSDFKKGVSETLGEGDFETRYDLGIAYREMELYEDAIGEFRFCLDSPDRRFDSLYLMGICTRELSRFEDAVNHFEQALALPEIPAERLAGVYFDLSIAQEAIGEIERACGSLKKVIEIEPDFPGASERLASLEAGGATPPKLGEPGEGFESFDELFSDDDDDEGGDVAMVEAVPAEAFESFDDVIEDAETLSEDQQDSPKPDPDENSQSARKTGRKRISFV